MPNFLAISLLIVLAIKFEQCQSAIAPPPWANPNLNPCASEPQGWQLIYWPDDSKCYKIFKVGHPCSNGMELVPKQVKDKLIAECRCPPKTAQSIIDNNCYEIFTKGPCEPGSYFAPLQTNSSSNTKGRCIKLKPCKRAFSIYHPKTEKCYRKYTKGPCSKGLLLTENVITKLPECQCSSSEEFEHYRYDDFCYQHFTPGPCWEKGHLFLPDRTCGCFNFLPHYHQTSQKCFELGTKGPCHPGETFNFDSKSTHAKCQCKPGYIRYQNSPTCYRPHTKGPCPPNHILHNTTHCIVQPCLKNQLYFPKENQCYNIGSQGPCPTHHLVTFDFQTRPSIDGISYNGVCICHQTNCTRAIKCDSAKRMVKYKGTCYKLYSQGVCPDGAWLVPVRTGRTNSKLWTSDDDAEQSGYCDCLPGYSRNGTTCMPPSVRIAKYLAENFTLGQYFHTKLP